MKRLIEGVIKKKAHGGNQLYLSRMHKYVLNSLTIVLNEKKTERERERERERYYKHGGLRSAKRCWQ